MSLLKRNQQARKIFDRNPDLFPVARQLLILAGKVVIDMTPYEAKLAAGAFAFQVVADPARWPPNADPLEVMWSQSTNPDNSDIWMTFRNATQFDGGREQTFRVHFKNGRVVTIQNADRTT